MISCFKPSETRTAPDIESAFVLSDAGTVKFGDSPSHNITSFTIRPVDGSGYL